MKNEQNSKRTGKIIEYMKKIEQEITTLCQTAIAFTEDLEGLPFISLKQNVACRIINLQLKAYSLHTLGKFKPERHEVIQQSVDIYQLALTTAQDNLSPYHQLTLQLCLELSSILIKQLNQPKTAIDISTKVFDAAIQSMTDNNSKPNNTNYNTAFITLQKIRDLITPIKNLN